MAITPTDFSQYYQAITEPGYFIVTLSNSAGKVNEMEVEAVVKSMRHAIDNPEIHGVIFDVTQVEYFSSVGLSLLLRVHKAMKARKGRIAIANPNANIRELLHVTSLDTIWPLFSSVDLAKAAIAKH